MRLGLIGCGQIGGAVAAAAAAGELPGSELIGIADLVAPKTTVRYPLFQDVHALLELGPNLVVEAASAEAVRMWGEAVLASGADLMMVSVGALADPGFLDRLMQRAQMAGRRIHVPSGAIGGLDILKGARIGGLEECRLTTTKPPRALKGAPGIMELGIDLDAIDSPTVVFEGPANQAVRLFPKNVNVAAAVSLAGIGSDRTTVRIVADPAVERNVHEFVARGAFGEASVRLVNLPSPTNPRTSYLVILSLIAALRSLGETLQLGT